MPNSMSMSNVMAIMADLACQVKYNPYDITDHPGLVSEMRNRWYDYAGIH